MDGSSSNFGSVHSGLWNPKDGSKQNLWGEGHPNRPEPRGHNIWMRTDPLMLGITKEPHNAIKRVREPHYNWKMPDTLKLDTIKRNASAWNDSQDEGPGPSNQKINQRKFSKGSPDDKTEEAPGDLLGSILFGMKDETSQKQKWDGQLSPRELNNKSMMFDSNKFYDSNNSPPVKPLQNLGIYFKQKRIGNRNSFVEREILQSKARSLEVEKANGTKSVVQNDGGKMTKKENRPSFSKNDQMKKAKPNLVNHLLMYNDKESSANKKDENSDKKMPMQMTTEELAISNYNDEKPSANKKDKDGKSSMKKKVPMNKNSNTKAWRSKSSWKGSRKLGSMRTKWRPDRAYDFGRNHMEINAYETPNDDFDLCRY